MLTIEGPKMRSALGTVVFVAAALGLAGCSSSASDTQDTSQTDTRIVDTTTQAAADPAAIRDLSCPGFERMVQILPAGSGESSPEAEISAFTLAFGQSLPAAGYLAAPVPSTNPEEPDNASYVHTKSDGRIDARLTLVKTDGRWHVDSVLTCAE